ncbi:unnamed protein product [Trichobilharzia regenti]|nr:unnamed protein product [Trichobilharzia regenti]
MSGEKLFSLKQSDWNVTSSETVRSSTHLTELISSEKDMLSSRSSGRSGRQIESGKRTIRLRQDGKVEESERISRLDDITNGESVERGQGTCGLKERLPIQTAEERRLKSMQELARHYSPVHLKQNTRPHHPGENQSRLRWKT